MPHPAQPRLRRLRRPIQTFRFIITIITTAAAAAATAVTVSGSSWVSIVTAQLGGSNKSNKTSLADGGRGGHGGSGGGGGGGRLVAGVWRGVGGCRPTRAWHGTGAVDSAEDPGIGEAPTLEVLDRGQVVVGEQGRALVAAVAGVGLVGSGSGSGRPVHLGYG